MLVKQRETVPEITIFIGGMVTIPSHGWFMTFHGSGCSAQCIWGSSSMNPGMVRNWDTSLAAALSEDPVLTSIKNQGGLSPLWL